MSYYTTNAIYNEISSKGLRNFYWVSENAWILVYGDNLNDPKVLVLAFNEHWDVDNNIVSLTAKIARQASLPMIQVAFNSSEPEIDSVDIANSDGAFQRVSLTDLKTIFSQFGLPVSDSVTSKAINSAESSAYHHWQRHNLGRDIVVADIDLVKVKDDHMVILELKRSFYELNQWEPFPVDFSNFYVLEELCKRSGNGFFIVYNKRTTKPYFFDDPSKVSVFSFNGGSPEKKGEYNFGQVFNDK